MRLYRLPCRCYYPPSSLGFDWLSLSWFDAHLWAYADERGLGPILSEDFEDGRLYGRVRVSNPFRAAVHESAQPYRR